jgi:hypothetical protein
MGLFDYKFLILLGLTIVVYFIYKEIEYLRNKFEELENIIKKYPVLSLSKINLPSNEPVLEQISNIIPLENSSQKKNKILLESKNQSDLYVNEIIPNIDHENHENHETNENHENNENDDPENDHHENNDDDNDDDNNTTNVSESSKHLAIYSNDNELFDSNQNSFIESIEANKNDVNFDYDKMEPTNLKNTMESIINSLSSESNKEPIINNTKFDDIIEEKEKQLSEMSTNSSKVVSDKVVSDKVVSDKVVSDKVVSDKVVSDKVVSDKVVSDKVESLDEKTLNYKKLPEIKKIAEKYKILLTRKVKGQQKSKNKNELVTEILNKLK